MKPAHPADALQRYQRATGAVFDNATGLLRLTPTQFANLQSLFFTINGVRQFSRSMPRIDFADTFNTPTGDL